MTTWIIEYYDIKTDRSHILALDAECYQWALMDFDLWHMVWTWPRPPGLYWTVMGIRPLRETALKRPLDKPFRKATPTADDMAWAESVLAEMDETDRPVREIVPTHEDASATDVVTRWTHSQTKHFSDGLQKLLDEEQ